jgi:hypothetical protein
MLPRQPCSQSGARFSGFFTSQITSGFLNIIARAHTITLPVTTDTENCVSAGLTVV